MQDLYICNTTGIRDNCGINANSEERVLGMPCCLFAYSMLGSTSGSLVRQRRNWRAGTGVA